MRRLVRRIFVSDRALWGVVSRRSPRNMNDERPRIIGTLARLKHERLSLAKGSLPRSLAGRVARFFRRYCGRTASTSRTSSGNESAFIFSMILARRISTVRIPKLSSLAMFLLVKPAINLAST
jgi:hypothetical protein